MSASDNPPDLTPRDADLLAGIDRTLAPPVTLAVAEPCLCHEPAATTPESLADFCAYLAAATPEADPLFRDLLAQRLLTSLTQPRERPSVRDRLRSLAAGLRRERAGLPSPRRRVVPLLLAVLAAGSGGGAYLHGQGPTPVDAQTVLHRAAATGPGPNEASHATYTLSSGSDLSGSAEVWIGYDNTGTATELALSETMRQNGASVPGLSANLSAAGQSLLKLYDPPHPSSLIPSFTSPGAGPGQALEGMLVGTLLAQKLIGQPNAFTLRHETLDRIPVYALTLASPDSQTYYFNAQTYLLEGVDWQQAGRPWRARLDPGSYRTMPLSAVPANTFPTVGGGGATAGAVVQARGGAGMSAGGSIGSGLQRGSGSAPGGVSVSFSGGGPGAHLTISVSVPGLADVDLMPALAAACHTTQQAFASALATPPDGRSILVTCRQTFSAVSSDQLVSALQAPVQAALDELVRSGRITAVEESSDLAALRVQLTHLIASGIGLHLSGPAPDLPQP